MRGGKKIDSHKYHDSFCYNFVKKKKNFFESLSKVSISCKTRQPKETVGTAGAAVLSHDM